MTLCVLTGDNDGGGDDDGGGDNDPGKRPEGLNVAAATLLGVEYLRQ